jgi:hypothetical protein
LILLTGLAGAQAPESVYESALEPTPAGDLDRALFAAWKARGIQPARVCSDSVFIRRAYLDVLGILPEIQEVEAFLAEKAPDKRTRLIDKLLGRKEFADYWAMHWSDVLRVRSEFPINLWPNAVQAYHRWLHEALSRNLPYDQFARQLLTLNGSNFRVPAVNFFRAVQSKEPENLASAAALVFMGDRMETWPQQRREGLEVFFQRVGYKSTKEWKEEIVFFDTSKPHTPEAILPNGTRVKLAPDQDPRTVFADWLVRKDNPWFARAMANRTWAWVFGRGLIHEPDDIRPDNPPSCPEALAVLEKQFIASDYDFKALLREILTSTTYQLSCVPRSEKPEVQPLFAAYPLRRIDAEILIDILCKVTGTTEEYHSKIPEPFTWVPQHQRTVRLGDGSITSSFLELFGRPARDSAMMSARSNEFTAAQALHLLNSSHIREKIERGPRLRSLRGRIQRSPAEALEIIYMTLLSRKPTAEEVQAVKVYMEDKSVPRHLASVDIVWALINSPEFLYRH